jgi:hypothetical protein
MVRGIWSFQEMKEETRGREKYISKILSWLEPKERPNPNKTPKPEKTLLPFAYINKLVRSIAAERRERERERATMSKRGTFAGC